jgi:hypothetical protein
MNFWQFTIRHMNRDAEKIARKILAQDTRRKAVALF